MTSCSQQKAVSKLQKSDKLMWSATWFARDPGHPDVMESRVPAHGILPGDASSDVVFLPSRCRGRIRHSAERIGRADDAARAVLHQYSVAPGLGESVPASNEFSKLLGAPLAPDNRQPMRVSGAILGLDFDFSSPAVVFWAHESSQCGAWTAKSKEYMTHLYK